MDEDLCRDQLESPEINVNTLDVNKWKEWMTKYEVNVPDLLNTSKYINKNIVCNDLCQNINRYYRIRCHMWPFSDKLRLRLHINF